MAVAASSGELSHCRDTENLIFDNLFTGYPEDDQALLQTASVCKSWQNHPKLAPARPAAKARLQLHNRVWKNTQFPRMYDKAFRESGYSLESFPSIPLSMDPSVYVGDYISLRPEQMTHPVMTLKDRDGRNGFALLIRRKDNPDIKTVVVVHKRDPIPKSRYVYTMDSEVTAQYRRHHNITKHEHNNSPFLGCENGAHCREYALGDLVQPFFVSNLLKGQDPFFELVGPLPAKKEAPKSWVTSTVCKVASTAIAAVASICVVALAGMTVY